MPCVLIGEEGDSAELDTSEVKEQVNSSIPLPSNITTKSITWNTITLSWDATEGASSTRLKWTEASSGKHQQQTHLQRQGFLQKLNTASEYMLCVEVK